MQPIDIVVTTWKREWMTKFCLEAIRKNTSTPHRVILIDNGSSLLAQDIYLRSTDIYIRLDHNYGLEHAKWLGMAFVESSLFVSMDNDILVYKYENEDWLSRLIGLMNKYPEYGAIAPKPQVLVATGNIFAGKEDQELVDFGHVPGYARIMRSDWVREVGAWKDKAPLRGHEELWIGQKFGDKGYKMAWANNIECWHLFGKDEEDGWGYPKEMNPEDHGHNPVYPLPKNSRDIILEKAGVDIQNTSLLPWEGDNN